MIPKLTKRDVRSIKAWLEMGDPSFCPWDPELIGYDADPPCKRVCNVVFPKTKLPNQYANSWHPCEVYSQEYVIRMAKRMVRENEAPQAR